MVLDMDGDFLLPPWLFKAVRFQLFFFIPVNILYCNQNTWNWTVQENFYYKTLLHDEIHDINDFPQHQGNKFTMTSYM